jgi:hypothetical protein
MLVQSYTPSGDVESEMTNPLNALGDASAEAGVDWPDFDAFSTSTKVPGTNQPFVSLGRGGDRSDARGRDGGEIILMFDPFAASQIGMQIDILSKFETDSYFEEQAEVYVGEWENGPWTFCGLASNLSQGGKSTFEIAGGAWRYIRLVDCSNSEGSTDGFDVNSVELSSVSEVPTPSAAIGGMALLAVIVVPKISRLRRQRDLS